MTSPAASAVDFDRNRVGQGELIAGISGAALFIFLFFDWFAGLSAWEAFDVVDLLLAIIALGAVALAVAQAMAVSPRLPFAPPLAIALAGFAATTIVLTFVLEGDERKIGLYLALISAIGITYGGWRAMSATGLSIGGAGVGSASSTAPTTPMAAPPAGVSPGKEGPGAPQPGTSTGAPGEAAPASSQPAMTADPVPGETAGKTTPGLAGDQGAEPGTTPPGLTGDRTPEERGGSSA